MTCPERLVVFRFDRDPLICRSRVEQLRSLNPGVQVHGLYGGADERRSTAYRLAGRSFLGLDGLFFSPHAGMWNWRHGDLALLEWHRRVGKHLSFDVLHLVEWDLVCFESLDRLYRHVPSDALGLTCLTPVSRLLGNWAWLRGASRLHEWEALLDRARTAWGEVVEPYACLGVGPCLPRGFLDAYAALDVPELCHDELRVPLAGAALGFPLVDSGLRRSWWEPAEDPFFNVGGPAIDPSVIRAELSRSEGRRAFHPVRARLAGL